MTIRGSVLAALAGTVLAMSAAVAAPASTDTATSPTQPPSYWATPHAVTTHGEISVEGRPLRYTAIAGTLVLHDPRGRPTGAMFYAAYFKEGTDGTRPIAFLYNGGPGSSSAPLHIGAFGPVRVVTVDHGRTPPAPYSLTANPSSLLDAGDLVFVDAMGTGFSRILGADAGGVGTPDEFYGVDADAKSFTQFIKLFLSKYGRWNSPKFLVGESYGTTRSAAVAYRLEQQGIGLNGIVLLSTILNFDIGIVDQPNVNPGVNLPYALALPSYAAVAWYQNALPARSSALLPWLGRVQSWAMGPYLAALQQGSALPQAEATEIAKQMSQFTGLSTGYLLRAGLRVSGPQFEHQLLLDRGEATGQLDGRFTGPVMDPMAAASAYDPVIAAIGPPYVAAINEYLRGTLHFGGMEQYEILSDPIGEDWNPLHIPPGGSAPAGIATNVMPDLAAAMTLDPDLKIMVNAGYFDLTTPYYAAVYQMRQLPIRRELQQNIEYRFYRTGHMIYLDPHALGQLHANIASFIRSADGRAAQKDGVRR